MLSHIHRELGLDAPASLPRSVIEKVSCDVSRRGFLKGGAAFALAVQFLPGEAEAFVSYKHGGLEMPNGVVNDPHVFVAIDPDGTVFLTGRSKDVIIRGSHNIDPAMIEETVGQHPAVEMAAAVGMPDAYAGELPMVYVTLKPGQSATSEDILSFLGPRIPERPAMP